MFILTLGRWAGREVGWGPVGRWRKDRGGRNRAGSQVEGCGEQGMSGLLRLLRAQPGDMHGVLAWDPSPATVSSGPAMPLDIMPHCRACPECWWQDQ